MDDIKETLGDRIRRARRARRYSQAKLGAMCFISQNVVSDWERNKRAPSDEAIERIAKATNKSVEHFTELLYGCIDDLCG